MKKIWSRNKFHYQKRLTFFSSVVRYGMQTFTYYSNKDGYHSIKLGEIQAENILSADELAEKQFGINVKQSFISVTINEEKTN